MSEFSPSYHWRTQRQRYQLKGMRDSATGAISLDGAHWFSPSPDNLAPIETVSPQNSPSNALQEYSSEAAAD